MPRYLWYVLMWVCLVSFLGTLFASCTWISVSFFRFGNFSAIISSNTIFNPPLLLFSFCQTLYYLTGLLYYFHFFFIWFSVCCSYWVISIILSSQSLIHHLFILLHYSFCCSLPSAQLSSWWMSSLVFKKYCWNIVDSYSVSFCCKEID